MNVDLAQGLAASLLARHRTSGACEASRHDATVERAALRGRSAGARPAERRPSAAHTLYWRGLPILRVRFWPLMPMYAFHRLNQIPHAATGVTKPQVGPAIGL